MRITINLTRREYDALSAIAIAERRPPRDQAARFVSAAIRESKAIEDRVADLERRVAALEAMEDEDGGDGAA